MAKSYRKHVNSDALENDDLQQFTINTRMTIPLRELLQQFQYRLTVIAKVCVQSPVALDGKKHHGWMYFDISRCAELSLPLLSLHWKSPHVQTRFHQVGVADLRVVFVAVFLFLRLA